jgi:hypothetical protein
VSAYRTPAQPSEPEPRPSWWQRLRAWWERRNRRMTVDEWLDEKKASMTPEEWDNFINDTMPPYLRLSAEEMRRRRVARGVLDGPPPAPSCGEVGP